MTDTTKKVLKITALFLCTLLVAYLALKLYHELQAITWLENLHTLQDDRSPSLETKPAAERMPE